ncbi:hypothetical protein D3C75_622440 [compost metagenome]
MVDAAVVGHQHQVMPRSFVCQRFAGELAVTAFQPVLTGHRLAKDEMRGLPCAQFRAAEHIGVVQAQLVQPLANTSGSLAASHGDAGGVVQARAGGAVAALGVADHHDHRTFGPVLQQAAVTQLSIVAKLHDVRPRRQPGAQRRHDHAQAKGGTEGFAGQASLAPGVDGRVPQGVAR